MTLTSFIILLVACLSICHSSIYSQVKNNIISLLGGVTVDNDNAEINIAQKNLDVLRAHEKAQIMKRSKDFKKDPSKFIVNKDLEKSKERYRVDPVLNYLARRSKRRPMYVGDTGDSSSSLELRDWKEEWKEEWTQKKLEAINSSFPKGDTVNMVAARPWGVSCGDPNQHDMPWGSCMLPMECEPEYRIYRGDYFCGRTQFVCCALQASSYDLYQGFDVSFADSELATDSEEIRNRHVGSKEKSKKKRQKDTNHRKRKRDKRKREIKRNIRKILIEIKKILNRSYRNGTAARKRKTRQLKKFIETLKKQYQNERLAVQNIHELELENIDNLLQRKLDQIKGLNQDFIKNHTFRDIVVNGSVSPKMMRQLVKAYPELTRMLDSTRRRGSLPDNGHRPDYLEYDIEYGLLYY